MPTAFCSIADAYGDDFGKTIQPKTLTAQLVPKQQEQQKQEYKCPYCNNCNQMNNQFQQKVADQIVGQRPQWYPQESSGPWRRMWREDFTQDPPGMAFGRREAFTQEKSESLLRVILWLLIALFTIQLVDMVVKIIST